MDNEFRKKDNNEEVPTLQMEIKCLLIPFDLADDHFFGHVVICLVFQHWHFSNITFL